MDRYLLISADGHTGAPWEGYRDYLENAYHGDYEAWLAKRLETEEQARFWRNAFFNEDYKRRWNESSAELTGRDTDMGWDVAVWDPDERIQQLDRQGIVAEVLYPDGRRNGAPFSATGVGESYSVDLQEAGARAYNRWLAAFCADRPERHLGVASVAVFDVDRALAEIRWAKQVGLAGINLPTNPENHDLPLYHHPRYEPIWSLCEELDFPVHNHLGGGKIFGVGKSSFGAAGSDLFWYNHRPFWQMLAGGVYERHPRLKQVLTEQGMDWVPGMLRDLDALWDSPAHRQLRNGMSLRPSEYWQRNCWVGHSAFQAKWQWDLRYEIGVDKIMWGADFPHPEGIWPHTRDKLRECFAAVPEDECRRLLGGNAVDFYGLEAEKLAPIVDRIGPSPADLQRA